jgi:hypothetical protein
MLTITTRNILPNEYDDGEDFYGDEEEEEEEAYLNLHPMGAHLFKERKERSKDINYWRSLPFDRWRGILLSLSLPRLLHYLVTILLVLILLGIVVFGRGPRGGVIRSYVRPPPSLT